MCISGVYAFTRISILSIENRINTGAVKIDLTEYTLNGSGKEVQYDVIQQNVFPGQVISLIPRISNLGDSSYIRAKIAYVDKNNNTIIVPNENIGRDNNNWVRIGDYWYYKQIVNNKDKIDVFKTIKIPTDMSNEYQGGILQLNIDAEAIQASNFNPNFESSSPWGDIKVEKASDVSYNSDKIQLGSSSKVTYENSANLYIDIGDQFFRNVGKILPGDVLTQDVNISNPSAEEIECFVSIDKLKDISQKSVELLEKMNLTISDGDKTLYNGKLIGNENISLGKYKSKDKNTLKFTINIPKDIGNDYASIESGIYWKFSINKEDAKQEGKPEPKPESPQTGDTNIRIALSIFFISAICLILVIRAERKNK